MRKLLLLSVVLISAVTAAAPAKEPKAAPREEYKRLPSAIFDYVAKPEPKYGWKLEANTDTPLGHLYEVSMRSQTWQGITWEHSLTIHEPENVTCQNHMLLFVTGGRNGRRPEAGQHGTGFALAKMTGARVAMLYQVPNQPLFDDRYEDDLITETWLRYLQSGDEKWPLLFPMVKSAVKAMDTLEAVANEHWKTELKGFVITGASKRGWTSWLTPVVDKRVVGTAPMVIDVLNFRPQMQHQLDVWGAYSDQIHDYSSKGLIKQGDEAPREQQLRVMMDPYTYRSVLSLPKLMINGTNDQYWVVDAMKLYWPDLVGPKFVLQVPNAGHGLGGGGNRVGATIAAFFRHVVQGRDFPKITWKAVEEDAKYGLQLNVTPNPQAVKFWRAHSASGDFRESRWSSEPMAKSVDGYLGWVEKPANGQHVAYFGEMQFEVDGQAYWLSTVIQRH